MYPLARRSSEGANNTGGWENPMARSLSDGANTHDGWTFWPEVCLRERITQEGVGNTLARKLTEGANNTEKGGTLWREVTPMERITQKGREPSGEKSA